MNDMQRFTAEEAYYHQSKADNFTMWHRESNGVLREIYVIQHHTPDHTYTGRFALLMSNGWDEVGAVPDMVVDAHFPVFIQEVPEPDDDDDDDDDTPDDNHSYETVTFQCDNPRAWNTVYKLKILPHGIYVAMLHTLSGDCFNEIISFDDFPEIKERFIVVFPWGTFFRDKAELRKLVEGLSPEVVRS